MGSDNENEILVPSQEARAVLLIPYFGAFPVWFELFLISCGRNANFRFLIYTDQRFDHFPKHENVQWKSTTLEEVCWRLAVLTGLEVPAAPPAYKLCDFRPAYGELFADDIKEPFWGHCDIDVIWGRLGAFLTPAVLENDIISGHPNGICGALSLYRNSPTVNSLYRTMPEVGEVFTSSDHFAFDEAGFSNFVKDAAARRDLRLVNLSHAHSESRAKYIYVDGKIMPEMNVKEAVRRLFGVGLPETMFFHFRTWKSGMRYDFDPTAVRGWTLRPETLSAIA